MSLKIRHMASAMERTELLALCLAPAVDSASRNGNDSRIMKSDGTTMVWQTTSTLGEVVVKRYNTKNPWHAVRRNFQVSRAMNCWRMAAVMSGLGIRVAEPVGVVEQAFGPLCGKSWYISRYVDQPVMLELVRNRFDDPDNMQGLDSLGEKIAAFFVLLKDNHLSHGDMKATNILVDNDGELVFLDLDASRVHSTIMTHERALAKDRARFLRNWAGLDHVGTVFESHLCGAGISA